MTITCPRPHRPPLAPPGLTCSACGAVGLVQRCGVCARDLCPPCYGLWVGLACNDCRKEKTVGRYDLEPLCDAVGLPPSELARHLRWSGSTTRTAATIGLDEYRADTAAVAFGLHPALVWPDWLEGGEVQP